MITVNLDATFAHIKSVIIARPTLLYINRVLIDSHGSDVFV